MMGWSCLGCQRQDREKGRKNKACTTFVLNSIFVITDSTNKMFPHTLSVVGDDKTDSSTTNSVPSSLVGASGWVWAMATKRSVGGRVSVRGQLPLCHPRLPGLVRVRGHSQCLPLPRLQETQLSHLQGMKCRVFTLTIQHLITGSYKIWEYSGFN